MGRQLTIIGAGAWGTTLAHLARLAGHTPTLWSRRSSATLREAIAGCELLVSAVPMSAVKEIAGRVAEIGLPEQVIIVSTTKGLSVEDGVTAGQVWAQYLPRHPLVILSGPNLAKEIMAGLPCATVVASYDPTAANIVQATFASPYFRVYTNPDPIGVEMGGTLKNVIAIAVGACDGLHLGANAKAALITRSLAEIIRIGRHWGAQMETFWGLSGLGDLLATCNSNLSRNYRLGYALAQGQTLPAAVASIEGTIEGINTTRALIQIADRENIYMPVCRYVYELLEGRITPQQALAGLMARELKPELISPLAE
ncbi:MAG: NAD(P)H-dependent glycerol-3-phosphate dehydrogenase [Pseudanabaenaceae cyanobacterium]